MSIHHPKAPQIKEIIWQPPLALWIKCNIDGASKGNPETSACEGIFRNHEANMLYCFAKHLGNSTSYQVELCGIMIGIEIAHHNHWNQVWFETDSSLVILAIKSSNSIPWSLRNRWYNAMNYLKSMNYIITNIYREGNQVADILANYALNLDSGMVWQEVPLFINLLLRTN